MRIAVVLPRGMCFSPHGATSIDLCVRDLVAYSRHRDSTAILGDRVEAPFEGFDYRGVARQRLEPPALYAARLARAARALKPDVILVQQHVEMAAWIARLVGPVPVLVHRHGLGKGFGSGFRRWRYRRLLGSIAHTILVSDMLRRDFVSAFPQFSDCASTLYNGIDLSLWQPAPKENLVAYVGRASADKGVVALAGALAQVLPHRPAWRASFMVLSGDADRGTIQTTRQILSPVMGQVEWAENRPLEEVRSVLRRAAIAVVPSIVREGFGRSAMEAHASGAALISSGSGGLAEVSGDAAIYLDEVTVEAIQKPLGALTADPAACQVWQQRSRRRAEESLDIHKVSAQLDSLYRDVRDRVS
jgi:glycosyltransferase involved in cell wall biosynthesis